MATDARGHTVPASTDHPQRADLLSLSLTTNGLTTVADTTARTAYIAALAAASPAQTVSTSKPALIYRTDSATVELSVDGTNWFVVPTRLGTTYAVTWSASVTNPTVGNGSVVGNWTLDDQFIDFDITVTFGSTTTAGSGNYSLSLPTSPLPAAGRRRIPGMLFDSSAGSIYLFDMLLVGTATGSLYTLASPIASVTAVVPVTLATGDILQVAGRYRHV